MDSLRPTDHFELRARQRGYRTEDLRLIQDCGTQTEDGVVLRRRDIDGEMKRLDRELKTVRTKAKSGRNSGVTDDAKLEAEIIKRMGRLPRLAGSYIPSASGCALTVYRPCARRLHRILGKGRRGRRAGANRRSRR